MVRSVEPHLLTVWQKYQKDMFRQAIDFVDLSRGFCPDRTFGRLYSLFNHWQFGRMIWLS